MAAEQRSTEIGPQTGSDFVNRSESASTCIIHSKHPLVFGLIHDALQSDPAFCHLVKPHYASSTPVPEIPGQILVLDACSVEDWALCIDQWRAEGGAIIVLLSPDAHTRQLELHLLCIGVAGVLPFGNNLTANLPKAVRTVAEGGFWSRRAVLNLYLRKTIPILQQVLTGGGRLTAREGEVVDLVQQRASNRVIAQKLAISERTAKFHVSNILRKLNLSSRRELQRWNRSFSSLHPEWLLSHQPVESQNYLSILHRTESGDDRSPSMVIERVRPKRKSQTEVFPPSAAAS